MGWYNRKLRRARDPGYPAPRLWVARRALSAPDDPYLRAAGAMTRSEFLGLRVPHHGRANQISASIAADVMSLWTCGQREEALPTCPQRQQLQQPEL